MPTSTAGLLTSTTPNLEYTNQQKTQDLTAMLTRVSLPLRVPFSVCLYESYFKKKKEIECPETLSIISVENKEKYTYATFLEA